MSVTSTIEPTTSEGTSTKHQLSEMYARLLSELLSGEQEPISEVSETIDRPSKAANYCLFLWFLQDQPTKSFRFETQKWRSYYSLFSELFEQKEEPTVSQSLQRVAVELFEQIKAVSAIYQDEQENETILWVFTDNEKYDDELMDLLISQEEKLLDTFPESSILVRFVPSVLCQDHREVVGYSAQLILER